MSDNPAGVAGHLYQEFAQSVALAIQDAVGELQNMSDIDAAAAAAAIAELAQAETPAGKWLTFVEETGGLAGLAERFDGIGAVAAKLLASMSDESYHRIALSLVLAATAVTRNAMRAAPEKAERYKPLLAAAGKLAER